MTAEDWTLMTLMHQGGWVMWVLLAMSVVAAAVTLERTWVLYRHRTEVAPFLGQLRQAVLNGGSVAAGIRLCEATRGPLAAVVKAALLRFDEGREEMERGMEAAARYELRRLERRLAVLATTANVAPLLGFLGTVTGMIASFGVLKIYGTTNPALVAEGIEEALTTTAAGLTVAIPVQLAYNTLSSRIARLVGDIEIAGDQLVEWAHRSAGGPPPRPALYRSS
jgi:biopolymer transport protein ExbB